MANLSKVSESEELNQILKEIVEPTKPKNIGQYFKANVKKREYKTATELYELARTKKIKHKHKIRGNGLVEFINEDIVLSLNWHFYKKILKMKGKTALIKKYKLDKAIYSIEELSDISEYVFKKGTHDYEYIVGIQTLYGWKEYDDPDEIVNKMRRWVNNDFKPKYQGNYEVFLKKFRNNVRKILRWRSLPLEFDTTAEDYCTNIAETGTSGSAFDPHGPRAEVLYNGEEVKIPNSKFAKSVALSVEEKMKRLFRKEKQIANVSQKVEFYPKVRLIVSAGYNTTLRMRFIDRWLSQWMKGYDLTTLYQTKKDSLNMWMNFANNKTKDWNIPIDQTSFDHNVTKDMVLIMCNEQTELIRDKCINNEDILKVSKNLEYELDGGEITYKNIKTGKVTKLDYKSGILSGWQFTAHFDTLANIAENMTAREMADEVYNIKIEQTLFNAQGDDQLVKCRTLRQAIALVCCMRIMGFLIHPKKTFFSQHHNEYLRKYSKDGEINGYASRMVNGLLWIYPGEKMPDQLVEKLSSTLDTWTKFCERVRFGKGILLKFLKSEYSGQKIDKETYNKYLSTDKIYGGAELTEGKQYLINTTAGKLMGKVEIPDQGYKQFHQRFGQLQSREMESWILNVIKMPDVIKHERIRKPTEIEINEVKKIEPIEFQFIPSLQRPTTARSKSFPPNVIFGKSQQFLSEVFPDLDSFADRSHAPKSWIYSYVTGQVKTVAPKISGMSQEFSTLLFAPYEASVINAMYYKRNVPDKWLRLNQHVVKNFELYIKTINKSLPRMY